MFRKQFLGSRYSILSTITFLFYGNMDFSQQLLKVYYKLEKKELSFNINDSIEVLNVISEHFKLNVQVSNYCKSTVLDIYRYFFFRFYRPCREEVNFL